MKPQWVPLLFYPPTTAHPIARSCIHLPKKFKFRIPFSETDYISWGRDHKNYIVQQAVSNKKRVMVSLCIHIEECSLLPIKCLRAFNGIQYTIQGDGFAHLLGFGFFPVISGTYTLQYIPEGAHEAFFEKGYYQFFYILDKGLVELLASEHVEIAGLVQLQKMNHCKGQQGLRMHFDSFVDDLLNQVKTLKGNHIDTIFTL